MSPRIPDQADVIVVGAGTAGAVAARRVAASGARVLLVERLRADDVGRKVCGNALTADGIAAIQRRVSPPSGAEIAMRVDSGVIVLPDARATVSFPSAGLILNRLVFGQRLLRDARSAGVLVLDSCACVGWSDRSAVRVRVRSEDGAEADISAKIVIDATGYRGVLTRAGGPSHPDSIARSEVGIGTREIAVTAEPFEPPVRATIVLSPDGAPGGYGWVFPMGRCLANAGVGAPLAAGTRAMKDALARLRERTDVPRLLEPVEEGSGMLPLRPPLASMVGDGFLSVGDAACQTNPLHGGGIAPSIVGGALAGETAARALSRKPATAAALWGYAVAFMREIGCAHAMHAVLRRFLLALPPADVAFIAETLERTVGFSALAGPSPRASFQDALRLLASASTRPTLALSLVRVGRLMESARRLYEDYPDSPEKLDRWRRRADALARAPQDLPGGTRP